MRSYRPTSSFIADALGLDFLNAIAPPPSVRTPPLKTSDDLLAWLDAAKLVPPETLTAVRTNAVPGELDAIASQARTLADWFRMFVMKHKGSPLPADVVGELQPLNRIMERDLRYGQVDLASSCCRRPGAAALAWRPQRHWRSPDSLLLPIAEAMGELVCEEDFSQIRECEGAGCNLLFLDRTNGRGRRWCNMAVCGNRAKQAARRETARDDG
ncbi:MAG TPA: CGNR zinc finger domain-containing protein [Aliidongia sp.]|nr:CGNR zinc finger domain-containing protein [Aliidongia sp.]